MALRSKELRESFALRIEPHLLISRESKFYKREREREREKRLPIKIDVPTVSVRILAGNLSIFIVFGRYFFMIDLSPWLIYLYIIVFS